MKADLPERDLWTVVLSSATVTASHLPSHCRHAHLHLPRTQVVNADVPERDLWTVVLGSAAVSQQLATVVAAVSVPVHLRLGYMSGSTLLLLNVLLLTIGTAVQ